MILFQWSESRGSEMSRPKEEPRPSSWEIKSERRGDRVDLMNKGCWKWICQKRKKKGKTPERFMDTVDSSWKMICVREEEAEYRMRWRQMTWCGDPWRERPKQEVKDFLPLINSILKWTPVAFFFFLNDNWEYCRFLSKYSEILRKFENILLLIL